ncbi:MAG: hypothetical protein ACXW28_09105 [Thermoanaerobaculia bacterium]
MRLRLSFVILVALLIPFASVAKDAFPKACVDCHVNAPGGKDMRLSTLSKAWAAKTPVTLMAKVSSVMPKGATLKGKHPPIGAAMFKDIPASCKKCHSATAKTMPPLAPMIHAIHFGGDKNEFVSKFKGDCTHCHKVDAKLGVMAVPSGAEK